MDENDGSVHETCAVAAPLCKEPGDKWTKRDLMLLALNILVKFGDGVEIYLPGVITQLVSCQMKLTSLQEGILAITLFVTMGTTVFVTAFLTDRLGRRRILLLSLYISILVTIICAVVPNYYTLLLSRGLLGFCIGLNASTMNVFYAEQVSTKEVYKFGTLASNIAFAVGGGWVAVLGYFLFNALGWRIFVLCTSIPVFLPPIFMLHIYLTKEVSLGEAEEHEVADRRDIEVSGQTCRVFKASTMTLINTFQGFGTIMLLPSLIRADNERSQPSNRANTGDCASAVQGTQFLLLALVHGGTNIIGRALGYFLQNKAKFRTLQPVLASVIGICYIVLIFENSVVTFVTALGLAKLVYAMMAIKISLITFDRAFLGTENIALNCGKVYASGLLGAIIGNTLAAFFSANTAVITAGILSGIQV